MKARFRRLRSERGAELIEFALVLPILLLVVLGIVDFGFVFQRLEVVTNAAREGARVAVLPNYASSDAAQRAWNYVVDSGLPTTGSGPTDPGANPRISVDQNVLITVPGGSPGSGFTAATVNVSYSSNYLFVGSIMRWFGGSLTSVPINGSATMRLEAGGS